MLEQVTWRHVGYAVLGAGIGGILGAGILLAILPAIPAAEIVELVRNVELFESAEPRIRELDAEWTDAINQGDVDRVVALFAPDARILAPSSPARIGSGAIRSFVEQMASRPGLTLETVIEEIHASSANDLAFSAGSYRMSWESETGERVETRGNYSVVWGRRNGEWKVLVDSFNTEPTLDGSSSE